MSINDLLSTIEAAKILKISRQAMLKRISSKNIKAIKVGRNYVIPRDEVLKALGEIIGEDSKNEIDKAIKKAMSEYQDAFKKLGKE